MARLVIQVHPHRSPQLDMASLRSHCECVATDKTLVGLFCWQNGFDQHTYVNLTFETDYPSALWKLLHQQLYQASAFGNLMQNASIATCEGQRGWDDYLLLHHFNPDIKRDTQS